MKNAFIAATAAALLGGCSLLTGSVDEDNYWEKSASATCKFYKDCQALYFWYYYDDVAECEDELLDNYEDAEDFYDDCDFDDDKASECLAYMNGSCKDLADDFEDYIETCSEVWECDFGYY